VYKNVSEFLLDAGVTAATQTRTPGSDQANPLKHKQIMAFFATNFALDAPYSPKKRLAKGGNATRPGPAM